MSIFVSPATGHLTSPPDVCMCVYGGGGCVKVSVNLFQITVTKKAEVGQQQNLVDSW